VTRKSPREEQRLKGEAFREMFDLHFVRVLRFVEGQVSDRAAAEDIAADVFSVAWQKFDRHDPFGLPWLIRTAIHKVRDFQRREYRKKDAMSTVLRLAEVAPEERDALEIIALQEALRQLSPDDQHLLRLTYWDGMSAGEVAATLRIRPGSVWTRLHRARNRLRTLLDVPQKVGEVHGRR
jgi:RNA polymerase sigma-70 factor (ECF subfamily)